MRASEMMTTPAVCVRSSTLLGEVAEILAVNGFTAVPVVDAQEQLVGLVSEADLIRERFGLRPQSAARAEPYATAGEVMTSPVEFVRPDATLSALAKCMITGRRRSVPVVEGPRVVGVVTRRDLVAMMARRDDLILRDVHRQLELEGFPHRWLVRVQAGVVHLFGDADPKDQHEATVVAESVPGVMRVTVSGPAARSAEARASGIAGTHSGAGSGRLGRCR